MRVSSLTAFLMFLTSAVQVAFPCPTGKYFFNGVCELCPDNCSICHSASICSECKAGYFGESCSLVCNANCLDNSCDKSTGVCISCSDGHFKDTSKNCTACPSNCLLCSSDTLCRKCKVGFKGRRCQDVCTNCKPGTACDMWTGECYECEQGHTGAACDKKCDSKCSLCQRLHGDVCNACSTEKYGKTCENDCSFHCFNKTCDDAKGFCTHGCQVGYWGTFCEEKCMTGCSSSICDRQNGSCLLHNPGGEMGTEHNCPNDCTCDARGICRECDPESEFMCGKHCPRICQNQICFRNNLSCLLPEEDLSTKTTKHEDERQVWPVVVIFVSVVILGSVVAILVCIKSSRRRLVNRNRLALEEVTGLITRMLKCLGLTDIKEPGSHDRSSGSGVQEIDFGGVTVRVEETAQTSAGISSQESCRKKLCSVEETRTEDDSRASGKDINDADTFQENAPLQRSV